MISSKPKNLVYVSFRNKLSRAFFLYHSDAGPCGQGFFHIMIAHACRKAGNTCHPPAHLYLVQAKRHANRPGIGAEEFIKLPYPHETRHLIGQPASKKMNLCPE